MSTRITNCSRELLQQILHAWAASTPRMFDHERSVESALVPLGAEPNTQIYALPEEAFLLLRNATPDQGALVQIITQDEKLFPDLEATKQVLSEAVKEYRLRRVSMIAPTGIAWRDYKLLGFKHEGRVRKGALFNNQWTDVEMLGALEHEVGKSHRRQRKRYRPKKDKQFRHTDYVMKPGHQGPIIEESDGSESE